MILGATLGSLGSLFVPYLWRSLTITIIAIVGIVMALCDFGIGGAKTPTLQRQTCPVWWRTLGRYLAVFLWGLDLGLGFTTIRVASLYWIVLLMVFVLASPLIGAGILGGYGLALALNLGVGILLFERKGDHVAASMRASQLLPLLKVSLAVVLLFWSAILIIVVLSGC